jgi:drug/metabolite transporter (DMT)-like permease
MSKSAPVAKIVEQNTLLGIAFMCLAVTFFPFMNSMVKYLSADYSIPMIVWARYAGHFLFMLIVFMPKHGVGLFKTGRVKSQTFRSLLLLTSTSCYFYAVHFLPLTTAAAISFTSPFIVVGLSIIFLGERVGPRRWAAVAVGFLGVLIIIRPGIEGFHWSAFLVLASAFCYACFQVMTRRLASQDSNLVTTTYTALVGAVVSSLALPFFWSVPIDLQDLLMLCSLGIFGGLGHHMVILALQYGEASVVSPFVYGQILLATILGYLIFGDFPDHWTWLGVAIIVTCGIYIAAREKR